MIQLLGLYAAKAALILALAAVLAGLAGRSSAGLRHAIRTAGLAGALLVLPVSLLLPRVPLGPAGSGAAGLAANLLVLLWLAVAAVLLGRILLDQRALRRVAAAAEAVADENVTALAREAAAAMGVGRDVRLRRWDGPMPATFGTWRPTILIPAGSEAWPAERMKLVLLHEMGHVARLDAAAVLLARIVRAVHWFNPLSWRSLGRVRHECEEACDARVLRAGAEPIAYARTLVEVLRESARKPPAGALAMTAAEGLGARLERICSGERPPSGRRLPAALLALAVGLAAAALAPLSLERAGYRDDGAGSAQRP